VATAHLRERAAEPGCVELTGDPQRSGHVVRGGPWLELIQEPESGLRERERRGFSVRFCEACCDERSSPCRAVARPVAPPWAFEQVAHGHLEFQARPRRAKNHLRGQERVPAELEEALIDARSFDTENALPDVCQACFQRGSGR